jgi:POT family proton-dependent oligopeptide transporter
MITKLSAPKVVGLMMGVWFLSSSLAHTLAGIIAKQTSSETVGGVVVDSARQLQTYTEVFQSIGLIGIGVGVLVLVLSPFLTKGMADVK